jgi:hypothetical protein
VGITGVLAHLSGWAGLAQRYRSRNGGEGQRFRFVSGAIGGRPLPIGYGSCLFLRVGAKGFRLSILFPFRVESPPLFVRWSQVASVTPRTFLRLPYTQIRLRDQWQTVCIRGPAGAAIQRAFAAARG